MPKNLIDPKKKEYAKTVACKALKWGVDNWGSISTSEKVKILCKALDKQLPDKHEVENVEKIIIVRSKKEQDESKS